MLIHQKSVLWFLGNHGCIYIYIEELPWKPTSIWCGYFLLENQLPFKKMVCNPGPSDSLHDLDLTSEKKKITRECFSEFWSENMISIDTGEQMAKIDQI
jgi:hypothetical protein